MEFRPGTCSACKASFRIPATFTANKAKCSKCGGVVEIGPITQDSATLTPVSTDPAKATSAPVASAAARLSAKPTVPTSLPTPGVQASLTPLPLAQPSTEGVQLSVNPQPTQPTPPTPSAVPAKPVPASKPPLQVSKPSAPSAKPVSGPVKSTAPANKGAVPSKAAASIPGKPAAAVPGKPGAPLHGKPAAKAAPAGAAKGKPSSKRAEIQEEDDLDRAERRRLIAKNKGPSPMLLAGAGLLFLGVGIGVYIVYQKAKEKNAIEQAAIAATKEANLAKQREDQAAREAFLLEEEKRLEAEKAAKATPAGTGGNGEVLAAESEPKPVEKPAVKPGEPKVVEGYDLSLIPDFPPLEGTTPEEWTELQSLAATFVDVSAGARASRAGLKLEETPKKAFPAILNQFKELDLTTEDGFRMADATQKTLERICHGHNMGWKYQHEENWLQYDQKAIKKWCDTWAKASIDDAAWRKLIKADVNKDAEGAGATPPKKIDDF